MVRFEISKWPFSTDKKVTVVKSCFYTVAEMHDVDLASDGSRFCQTRDQRGTRKPLGTYHGPGGFPYTAYLRRFVPARHNYDINATAG